MVDGASSSDVLAVDDAVLRASDAAGYGLTDAGFVPKPFSRIVAEKLALARSLFGADLDLGSSSALRKIIELSALEDARTWAALASVYDNQFVTSARGEALSRLGSELGLPRPSLEAHGVITLTAHLPAPVSRLDLPRGARLLTAGRHHVALADTVTLSAASPTRDVEVIAFYPGPEHNLDPTQAAQKIVWWNQDDPKLDDPALGFEGKTLLNVARTQAPPVAPEQIVAIEHKSALSGGELFWPDARYRELLLRAPRSIWTLDALQAALSLVPGVRQVQVRDRSGGLDANLPIFGTFNFIERLFGAEHDLASPYFFDVVVASTDAALWDGPDGLGAAIDAALEDVRPIGIMPRVQQADPVYVSVKASIVVRGLALPRAGSADAINQAPAAVALKARLLARIARYIDSLRFGEPVRCAEVLWAMMNEPGVADVQELTLIPAPRSPEAPLPRAGDNVAISPTQIASFVDSDELLRIV